jgi:hypothetical protein
MALLVQKFAAFQSLYPPMFQQDCEGTDDEGNHAPTSGDDRPPTNSVTCCHQGKSESCQSEADQQVSGIVASVCDRLPDVRSIRAFTVHMDRVDFIRLSHYTHSVQQS